MNKSVQILLVDDNPYFLDAAREFLLLQGGFSRISIATDEEEAVAQARQVKPDVILLDLNLTGRSGLALIPVFKQEIPTAAIIVMTLLEGNEYRTAALRAGADRFVLKNQMTETLVDLITEVMTVPPPAPEPLEDYLHRLVTQPESIRDAVVASDMEFKATIWNMAAEAMYGWTPEEVLGRNALEITQTEFPEGDKEKMLKYITKTGGYRGEVMQVRKDGTRFPVKISSFVLRDQQGQVTGYVSINRDMTNGKEVAAPWGSDGH